ncbi:DUF4867 family protein [Bacillus alveayuensis]|uniref:DUF4867 family protein n=1 Tax=Aeribacillus alveayuensis TaxID=279215 RepID=UPI0005CD742A|nr:DUF4867 family protein [Bacillus alveayuensis]
MNFFAALKAKNKHIRLFHVEDASFRKYGTIIKGLDVDDLIQEVVHFTHIPDEGNIYIHSAESLEKYPIKSVIENSIYGGFSIQIGYCNGKNSYLNGLEYHKGNEVNIACTDLVLFLGKVQDITENSYDTSLVEAFYIPKGTCLELFSTTLHFAPCRTMEKGFKCIVILPKGTNTQLKDEKCKQHDPLLFMQNKWLLAHPENHRLIERGAYPGLKGENFQLYF